MHKKMMGKETYIGKRENAISLAIFPTCLIIGSMLRYVEIHLEEETQIESLSIFASEIIRDYYDPIIGKKQNDYHLKKFQSVEGIKEQLRNGYTYYRCYDSNTPIGFFAFYPRGDSLYLSKFYVHKDHRSKGYGKEIISFLKEEVCKLGLSGIELNVNRFNPSRFIYERMGFIKVREEKIDVGEGFIMDDYVYKLPLD